MLGCEKYLKTKRYFYYICVLLAAALWGTAGIFVRAIETYHIGQMEMVLGRAFFSVLILGSIMLAKDVSLFKINLRDIWIFALDGVFSIVLFNFSYYTTMSLTSLSVAAVLLYTAPFFVVIISLIFFGKRLTAKKIFACVVAFLGCCLVSGFFDTQHRISGKALFFGLLTGFGYGLYTIFGDILIKKGYKTLTITFYVFLFALFGCLPFVSFQGVMALQNSKPLPILFLMAIFNTVLPYILYTTGLTGIDPMIAPIIATLEPVVATVIGALIFSEPLTLGGGFGIVLVLLSVVMLNTGSNTKTKVTANAKINLTLDITGKREDGYHFIDTIMQSVSLADELTVKKAQKTTVTCSDSSLSGEENIAHKAARLFFERTGITGGAEIFIKKNIPSAAGLGGGSADAAAVLLSLDRLYKTGLDYGTLCEMAQRLGADVPFFIKGGTQRARGIGEQLTRLSPLKSGFFVLAKADDKPSTGEMYRLLDSKERIFVDTKAAVEFCQNNDLEGLSRVLGNSFLTVSKNSVFEKLKQFSPLGVGLSGSGPTCFAVFKNRKSAKICEKALKAQNITCFTVRPTSSAIIFKD
ncbi:MAG: 4-(cytidine 5'-diphospho)-2-C-methyl-D-erythritol kinase [Acutalibacteraceae bacterium]|jgi:DME family drug/metabolite transporter